MVAVSGYEKENGTKVRAHNRDAPGARKQLGVLAAAVLAVFTMSQAGQAPGTDTGGAGTKGQGAGENTRPAAGTSGRGTARIPTVRIVLPTGDPQKAQR